MNWKERSGAFFTERGILRTKHLEDRVLAPALNGFIEWLSEFDGMEGATWRWIEDEKTCRKAHVRVPIHSDENTSAGIGWFNAEVFIRDGEICFRVIYPFQTGSFLGQRPALDIDIDAEILKNTNWSKEALEQYRKEEESGELLLPVYSIMADGVLKDAEAVYEEAFPIGAMFEADGICERLWGLWEERYTIKNNSESINQSYK